MKTLRFLSSPLPRIALMLPRFSRYGGVEQYGCALAEALAARGFAVDVLCARQEAASPAGVRVLSLGRPPGSRFVKMLWFLLRAERMRRAGGYDLCISLGKTWNQDIARVGGGPLQAFWRLSEKAWEPGVSRVGKTISRLLRPSNWLTLVIEKRMFTRTPCVVAISDSVRDWVAGEYPGLADPANGRQELLTIYNCPDLSRFHPPSAGERSAAREALAIAEGTCALGVATTNFALKGVGPLIRSLLLLPRNVHLYVAGGRNPRKYARLAAALDLGERVHFLGKRGDMQGFYHALDLFALPSFYDTLGNVVLEALACGVKTLCSGQAGASAFLPPERVIRDPGNHAEIAEKLLALRRDERPVLFVPKGSGIEEMIAVVERFLLRKKDCLMKPD